MSFSTKRILVKISSREIYKVGVDICLVATVLLCASIMIDDEL